MATITIEINNNKCRVDGNAKVLMRLEKAFAIKNPNAFFMRSRMPKGWDGMLHYITDRGYFKTGFLENVCNWLIEDGNKIKFIDERLPMCEPEIPKKIGNLVPRPYQLEAIRSNVMNKVNGIYHRVTVTDAATNAGKTLIMAGIYLAFKRNHNAIVLINDGDLYDQFKREMPELIGEEDFGYVRGKEVKWNKFTVCMVQSLSRNLKYYQRELAKFEIALIDEADLGDNKTYKSVLNYLFNTSVRNGLSGTIYMSKLKKDQMKNENLRSFFGNTAFKITKKEMVKKGHSTDLIIKIIKGSTRKGIRGDFKGEYDNSITFNNDRHLISAQRTEFNVKRDRLPAIIICQFHKHIDNMYKFYKEYFGDRYIIKAVHGATPDRKEILQEFRAGKIDILICSFIVRRGKNFPLLQYMQNAASSDSNETISQLMGRMERKHESKTKSYIEDLYDEGHYLNRHSKHRVNFYRKEGFKVIMKITK